MQHDALSVVSINPRDVSLVPMKRLRATHNWNKCISVLPASSGHRYQHNLLTAHPNCMCVVYSFLHIRFSLSSFLSFFLLQELKEQSSESAKKETLHPLPTLNLIDNNNYSLSCRSEDAVAEILYMDRILSFDSSAAFLSSTTWRQEHVVCQCTHSMVWYGMVEVCEGAPVAMGGWVLTDKHDLASCAANILWLRVIARCTCPSLTPILGKSIRQTLAPSHHHRAEHVSACTNPVTSGDGIAAERYLSHRANTDSRRFAFFAEHGLKHSENKGRIPSKHTGLFVQPIAQ